MLLSGSWSAVGSVKQLWRHSAYEALLTAVLLFGVVSVVQNRLP
jgi:hypothetical protein